MAVKIRDMVKAGILGLFLILVLNSCGSGSGSKTPEETTGAPGTYLFYFGGSLYAVDPADPGNPSLIDSNTIDFAVEMIQGTISTAMPHTRSNLHGHTVIYGRGGSLFKVSALKNGGTPIPVQLSSESDIFSPCNNDLNDLGEDLANPDNSQFLYSLSGPDGNCNTTDDVWKMVKVGMEPTDAPIPAREPVTSIVDISSGTLTGWLAIDESTLKRYDANFENRVPITPFTDSIDEIGKGGVTSSGYNIFLKVDNQLYAYNTGTGELSQPLHTFQSPDSYFNSLDGTNLYFVDGNSIYKIPQDGSVPSIPLVAEGSPGNIVYLYSTDNRVIYVYSASEGDELKAMAKTGGEPSTLDKVTSGSLYIMDVAGDRVYYEVLKYPSPENPSRSIARVVREDGTLETSVEDAYWVGETFTAQTPGVDMKPARLIRVEGINGQSPSGGTLKSVDGATNTVVATLGTVDSDINEWILFSGFGKDLLGWGVSSTDLQLQMDVFYLNTDTDNSLRRLTNTPDVAEYVILF